MKKRQFYLIIATLLVISLVMTTLLVSNLLPRRSPVSENRDRDTGSVLDDEERENRDYNDARDSETFSTPGGQGGRDDTGSKEGMEDIVKTGENRPWQEETGGQWISRESINIVNNSPEYDIEMYLCHDKDNVPFIELFYYMEGRSESVLYSASETPFMKDLGDSPDNTGKPVVKKGVLNTKFAKLYFFAEKKLDTDEILFDFYEIDLKNRNARKLHGAKGYGFSELVFSPDREYAAYSYLADREGKVSFLQVFNSNIGSFLVIDNRSQDGKVIGRGEDKGIIYSYFIERWRSSEELRLKEYSYLWDEGKSQLDNEVEISVVFNVKEGRIIYPDGGSIGRENGSVAEGSKKGESDTIESETLEEGETQEGSVTQGEGEIQRESETQKETGKQDVGENIPGEGIEEHYPRDQQPEEQQPAETAIEEGPKDKESETGEADEAVSSGEQKDKQQPQQDDSLGNDNSGASGKELAEGRGDEDKTGEDPSYSSAVPVLEFFYEYINERKFDEAYDLINETIRFNVLKKILSQMFQGVEVNTELNKSDIDVNLFATMIEASGIFKNVEIDEIAKEENDGSISKIYYYHAIIMDETSPPIIMPVIATLRNTPEGWKISAFDDG